MLATAATVHTSLKALIYSAGKKKKKPKFTIDRYI
jgi:hypothetical protein